MEILSPDDSARPFGAPKESLGGLGPEGAAVVLAAAADVAVVIDRSGIVKDVSVGNDLSREGYSAWVGRPWIETVTVESRAKVEELLRDATPKGMTRPRQVNHPSKRGGADVPVRYAALKVGETGDVIAVGRDLRAMAVLQQRLADAQQSMEREYARIRGAETRYRLLFQLTSEPVLIVEAASQRVVDANPTANQLVGKATKRIIGQSFAELFTAETREAAVSLLAAVRVTGRVDDVHATLASGAEYALSASLFRQDSASHFLVRLTPLAATSDVGASRTRPLVMQVVERMPEGFVVTDTAMRVLTANGAFLDMAQLATEEQARGELIGKWLGRPGIDMDVLASNLRDHGTVRLFPTVLRGEFGSTEDVEVVAVMALSGEMPCIGFTLRAASGRAPAGAGRELPRSVEQFTELVGRVPLKNLVRETTDMIERLCIEAALELTRDNRASAAEMLGLSRQSLYSKLRRYGLGDLDGDDADA